MSPLKICLATVLALALVLVGLPARAADPTIALYTIAPGGELVSLYGHSLACVEHEGEADPLCYDYGVARAASEGSLIWRSLRGEALFYPTEVRLSVAQKSFQDEERAIYRQALPLAPAQAKALAEAFAGDVAAGRPYAYDPRFDNCTTRLRDRIDEAVGGKLRERGDVVRPGPHYREIWEKGISGQVLPLAVTELAMGGDVDRSPTDWERLFLPAELRDAVRARLGAEPKEIYSPRQGIVLKTSPAAGRALFVALGVMLAVFVAIAARRGKLRLALGVAGALLGLVALVPWGLAVVGSYPELRHNWALLLVVPTDLAIGFLSAARLRRYLEVRLGLAGLVVLLGAVHVVARPAVPLFLFAGLPLGLGWRLSLRAATVRAPARARAAVLAR